MKGADRRIAAALQGIVEIKPNQFFILAELPDQMTSGFLQRRKPPSAKFRPGKRRIVR